MDEPQLAALIQRLELSWDEDLCPDSCSCHDSVGPLVAEVRRLQAELADVVEQYADTAEGHRCCFKPEAAAQIRARR